MVKAVLVADGAIGSSPELFTLELYEVDSKETIGREERLWNREHARQSTHTP
jgi:hypothetical protein